MFLLLFIFKVFHNNNNELYREDCRVVTNPEGRYCFTTRAADDDDDDDDACKHNIAASFKRCRQNARGRYEIRLFAVFLSPVHVAL